LFASLSHIGVCVERKDSDGRPVGERIGQWRSFHPTACCDFATCGVGNELFGSSDWAAVFVDLAYEAKTLARDGANPMLLVAVVPNCSAGRIDAAGQGRLGNNAAAANL
jgi:hypothetical protein